MDFVDKVMPLLFNMMSRFVIAFLLRSKYLFISWLQAPSAVILEPNKIKSITVSIVYTSFCHEVMGPDAMILVLFFFFFSKLPYLGLFICIPQEKQICKHHFKVGGSMALEQLPEPKEGFK